MVQVAPYGGWSSPITPDLIAKGASHPMEIKLDGDDVYWLQTHPEEGGRIALMRARNGRSPEEVSKPEMNVRTTVHEYGGGSYVAQDGIVAYSNYADQLMYLVEGDEVRPLTSPGMRYADGVVDVPRSRIVCVREDHTGTGEAVNTIVALPLSETGSGEVIESGHDFFSDPRLSPDGSKLCWLAWNHPQMPWTRTELWLADIDEEGTLTNRQCLIDSDESVFQPSWSPDGRLYFVSDRSNWWNLYRWDNPGAQPVLAVDAEFGRPQWVFGLSTYGFIDEGRMVCSYTKDGDWHLVEVDLAAGNVRPLETPYTAISDVRVSEGAVYFIGGAPTIDAELVKLNLESGTCAPLTSSPGLPCSEAYISVPRAIEFPTKGGEKAHAFFYAPHNPDFKAAEDEKPPLMVISHGGPTSATSSDLRLGIQYWTSRGFAVVDVNYGGSTGYGRAYRQRLEGQWGIVDVDDCIASAKFLVDRGEADGNRLVIRGGSAGGYTTLCALAFRDVFSAGASYFGIGDLVIFVDDTHKFESRYLDSLVGPFPEQEERYRERSALYYVDQLSCPVIFFQGLEDKVVPPNQAELMVEALRAKGLPVAYVAYEGEQHGFRRAENIVRSATAELYFYSKILGFPLIEDVEPVPIENLS